MLILLSPAHAANTPHVTHIHTRTRTHTHTHTHTRTHIYTTILSAFHNRLYLFSPHFTIAILPIIIYLLLHLLYLRLIRLCDFNYNLIIINEYNTLLFKYVLLL